MPTKKKPAKKSPKKRAPSMTLRDVCNVLEGIDTRIAEALDLRPVERLIASIDRLSALIEKEQQPTVENVLAPPVDATGPTDATVDGGETASNEPEVGGYSDGTE